MSWSNMFEVFVTFCYLWLHNVMYLYKFCDLGNIANLVIPRPSPTGEEVPGLGKVICLLSFRLQFCAWPFG
jgi:hypothetical protein